MASTERISMDLRSQDVTADELVELRKAVSERSQFGHPPKELIMLSGLSGTTDFSDLGSFLKIKDDLPREPVYLHYSLTFPSLARCSLYLDADRPARIVLEGPPEWTEDLTKSIKGIFSAGDARYRLYGKYGFLVIWASVVIIASAFLVTYVLVSSDPDPLIIIPVIISSGLLGIYLSLANIKELQPANTISLRGKRKWYLETGLHLGTVALGIVSAILATYIVSRLMQ